MSKVPGGPSTEKLADLHAAVPLHPTGATGEGKMPRETVQAPRLSGCDLTDN